MVACIANHSIEKWVMLHKASIPSPTAALLASLFPHQHKDNQQLLTLHTLFLSLGDDRRVRIMSWMDGVHGLSYVICLRPIELGGEH